MSRMNLDYERHLEGQIHRELMKLPELLAPRDLIARVMAAIEARFNLPWYKQSWEIWPLALRGLSLIILLGLFGGLCLGSWKLSHVESFATALQRPLNWVSGFGAFYHAITVLLNAGILFLKQLGSGIVVGCLAALALGYAMC